MKRVIVSLLASAMLLLGAGVAEAKSSKKGSFTFSIDGTVTCSAYNDAGALVGTATLGGSGTFNNTKPKGVSAAGTWDWNDGTGADVDAGNWSATKLESFQSYGGTNANWGGTVKFKATFTGGARTYAAQMWLTNVAGKTPKGKKEGCRLNLKDVLNFNKATAGTVSMTRTA